MRITQASTLVKLWQFIAGGLTLRRVTSILFSLFMSIIVAALMPQSIQAVTWDDWAKMILTFIIFLIAIIIIMWITHLTGDVIISKEVPSDVRNSGDAVTSNPEGGLANSLQGKAVAKA